MRISVKCLSTAGWAGAGAVIWLTWYEDGDDLSVRDVSPGEGAVVGSRVILRPGQGGREAPGHVVLEAGVGVEQGPLQLVTDDHVRHGGSEGGVWVESSSFTSILDLQGMTSSCRSRKLKTMKNRSSAFSCWVSAVLVGSFNIEILPDSFTPTIYKQVNTLLSPPAFPTPVVASVGRPNTGKCHQQTLRCFIFNKEVLLGHSSRWRVPGQFSFLCRSCALWILWGNFIQINVKSSLCVITMIIVI